MKLYLDDVRECPQGWTLVKTAPEMIRCLESSEVEEISLDHDLGPPGEHRVTTGRQQVL